MTIYKKIITQFSWCLLLAFSLLFSCDKEVPSIEQDNKEIASSAIGLRSNDASILDQIEFDGEMLVFNSWEVFEQAEAYLSEQVALHNEAFNEQYADLDDEEYNEIIEESEFDEYLPLTLFEEELGLYSKRQQMNSLIGNWLGSSDEIPIVEDYPDDFPILKQEMRSFFNENGQVNVGGQVITVDPIPLSPEFYFPCAEDGRTITARFFNNNRNLIIQTTSVTKLRFPPFSYQFASSNIRTYRLNNRGRWRSFRAILQSEMRSVFRDSDCIQRLPSTAQTQTTFSRGRRSSNTAGTAYRNTSFQQFKVSWCDMDGLGWANGQVARACIL